MTRENDNGDENGLGPNQTPHANTARMIGETYKDHDNVLHAVLYEFMQNSIDALMWSIAKGIHGKDYDFGIHFRINTEDNTVEMWDTVVGIPKDKLYENYMSLAEPGPEKRGYDTGGSQGKGFWAICGWGTRAYVESHTTDGGRFSACAWPTRANDNISRIMETREDLPIPNEFGDIVHPRPELERPGIYLQLQGVKDDDMDDLSDPEEAIEKIEKKFSFALSNPNINIDVTYTIDGETHRPNTYDFQKIVEEAAVVENEDLPEFYHKGKTRQLTGLTLINNNELPDGFEPPWTGVGMLKGSEYTTDIPYMLIWPYTPRDTNHISNNDLWGWVDASDLCPDREAHGHTGFRNRGKIYQQSGLNERVIEVIDDVFDDKTVEDDTEVAEKALDAINEYVDRLDPIEDTSGSPGPKPDGMPDDPKIHASTKGYEFDKGERVPFYILVTNPKSSNITNFHIAGELQRVIDEDGNEIPEEERDDPIPFSDTGEVPLGVTREKISDQPPGYEPSREGGYELRYTLKEAPDVDSNKEDVPYQIALGKLPVRDKTTHKFYVGDVEPGTSTPSGQGGGNNSRNYISHISYASKPDSKYRARVERHSDGLYVIINEEHPEFKQMTSILSDYDSVDVKTELVTKWGFQRFFIKRASDQINKMLAERGIENDEVETKVRQIIKERLELFDEFSHKFSQESPIKDS